MNIPEQVKKAAGSLVEMYGLSFDYLGKYQGKDAFQYRFPNDTDTGFPFVYLFDGVNVTEVTGFEALDIIGLFVENLDVVDVE